MNLLYWYCYCQARPSRKSPEQPLPGQAGMRRKEPLFYSRQGKLSTGRTTILFKIIWLQPAENDA
jgi:hypothetical protein